MQIKRIAFSQVKDSLFLKALKESIERKLNLTVESLYSTKELTDFIQSPEPSVLITDITEGDILADDVSNENIETLTIEEGGRGAILRARNTSHSLFLMLVSMISQESDPVGLFNKGKAVIKTQNILQRKSSNQHSQSEDREAFNEVIRDWLDSIYANAIDMDQPVSGVNARQESVDEGKNPNFRIKGLEAELFSIVSSHVEGDKKWWGRIATIFPICELDVLIYLCILSVELDSKYTDMVGQLNNNLSRRHVSFRSLSKLLSHHFATSWDLRRFFNASSKLRYFYLLKEIDDEQIQIENEAGLSVHDCVFWHILPCALNTIPDGCTPKQLNSSLEITSEDNSISVFDKKVSDWLNDKSVGPYSILQVSASSDQASYFYSVPLVKKRNFIELDIESVLSSDKKCIEEKIIQVGHYASAENVSVSINACSLENSDIPIKEVRKCLDLFMRFTNSLVFLCPYRIDLSPYEVLYLIPPEYGFKQKKKKWLDESKSMGIPLSNSDCSQLVSVFKTNVIDVKDTLKQVSRHGMPPTIASVRQIVSTRNRCTNVTKGIRVIRPSYTWDDIVLPEKSMCLLKSIPEHVKRSGEVLEEWGYKHRMPYGQAVTALFSGPSGTGKTMAAQVIASDLGVDVFQVDLAKTVSKYIGETEKNLDLIFQNAEESRAVLLFDEADALFGKRTEVKDAHDRNANMEVSYLLQRMESYSGLAILTTNLRQNVDNAFMRRLRFVVDFEIPDCNNRERIWRASFPKKTPLFHDINFRFLARKLELSGGSIQQISICAAFNAATKNEIIHMRHIVQASCEELRKLGMSNTMNVLTDLIPKNKRVAHER